MLARGFFRILEMIVLLTDFGQSEYVGVMKGVIYGIAPDASIVDLCHNVQSQSCQNPVYS